MIYNLNPNIFYYMIPSSQLYFFWLFSSLFFMNCFFVKEYIKANRKHFINNWNKVSFKWVNLNFIFLF